MTLLERRPPAVSGIVFAALITPLLSALSFPVIAWIFGNSFHDPVRVFARPIDWENLKNVEELWIFCGVIGAVVAFFLIHAQRCVLNKPSKITRALAVIAGGIGFAASIINLIFIAEEMNWIEVRFTSDDRFLTLLTTLSLVCSGGWALLTRHWGAYDVFRFGIRYVANAALLALLIAIPSHMIDVERSGFLSGIGTAVAGYFSLQVLLVCGVCELWRHRYEPRDPLRSAVLQELPARNALRESALVSAAAYLLLFASYAVYPLAYNDRLKLANLGQISFFILALFGVARGVTGFLLAEDRPLSLLGLFVLQAELAVLVAAKLFLASVP